VSDPTLVREIARRKTFAIISHPDAGKTTLTEKLLLYGGAIQLAGVSSAATMTGNHTWRAVSQTSGRVLLHGRAGFAGCQDLCLLSS